MVVLVTLTGAAPGCGYDNPGFKLKDSDPATEGSAATTEISGATVTSEPGTSTTVTPTTSTSTTESMTTQGPGVSGSETSTTDVDPTTSTAETSTTGGGSYVFPTDCAKEDQLPAEYQEAAADTFFINAVPQVRCDGLPETSMEQCQDLEFGKSEEWSLYFIDIGDNYTSDFMSVFAVRFAPPTFIHEDMNGSVAVPPEAFVRADVRMRIFRGSDNVPWQATHLGVFRFGPDDTWVEGEGFDLTPCKKSAPSFRCQVCPSDGGDVKCTEAWSSGDKEQPMPVGAQPVLGVEVAAPPPDGGAELAIKDLTKDQIDWLTTEGMMMFPTVKTDNGMLKMKTRNNPNFEYKPAMLGYYCKPTFEPN